MSAEVLERYTDLVPAYAFVFRLPASGTRFTVYAAAQGRYRIGKLYTLLLAPADTVTLPLTVEDAAFLRHCVDNAAQRWRAAITDAEAGANRPAQSRPAEPGHFDMEPTPAGYRHVRRLFTDELARVARLNQLLDAQLDNGRPNHVDGGPS